MSSMLIPEKGLVPFRAGFLPGRRWLVLAPHGDDETFGPGGALALAAQRDVAVTVAVLTDGAAQGEAEVRRAEIRAAAEVLGIPEPRHMGFPDRALAGAGRDLEEALAELLAAVKPDTVLVPSPVEVHPDHRATAVALQRVLRGSLRTGWVAAYEVGAALRPNLLVDIGSVWRTKERAAACYASQLSVRPYHRVMAGLAAFRALTLDGVEHAEALFVLPAGEVASLRAAAWAAAMGSPVGVAGVRDQPVRRRLARLRRRWSVTPDC